jgi:hypothetical protein
VPIGTEISATTAATQDRVDKGPHIVWSAQSSVNQTQVQPFQGTMVGSLLSLNAAPDITTSGTKR